MEPAKIASSVHCERNLVQACNVMYGNSWLGMFQLFPQTFLIGVENLNQK